LKPNIQGVDDHAHFINRSEGIFDNDVIKSIGWKANWNFAPGWTGTVDLSNNTAKRVTRDIEAYASLNVADTLTFDNSSGGTPQFTLGKALSYTDPTQIKIRDESGWSGVDAADGSKVPQAGYSKGPNITDKISALRVDLKTDLPENGWLTDIQFGGNYSKRAKDRITDEGVILSTTNNGKDAISFPGDAYVATNVGGTGINMLTFDPQVGLWPGATIQRKFNDDILSKTWTVTEKVLIVYAKSNIETKLADIPVRGNVGLQIVNTDQSSAGFRAEVGSAVTLVNPAKSLTTDGTKYTDFLPSLNLAGDLGSGNVVRMGLSKQIARPNLTDMRNSFAASVDKNAAVTDFTFNKFVGSSGNPNLKPFKATAIDLSYEKYFGNKGYLGAAAFYKKLDSYVAPQTNLNYDFTTYANQLGIAIPKRIVDPVTGKVLSEGGPNGVYTTTVNGSGGNLSGIELTASMPLSLVASWLEGLGFTASYSTTQSSVKLPNLLGLNPSQRVPGDGETIPVPGLSKNNTKLMVYYEAYGFSAFVAHNERSDYVGSVANDQTGGYPTLKKIQGSAWVSAQIGYEFQDGFAKGLGLRIEGNNLNKPTYRQLNRDGTLDSETKTGASVSLKLSYKYQ
jgi:iron complex outermembrane recepter protein